MDWISLSSGMPRDRDLPERAFRIAALTRVLEGKHYDHIPTAFFEEINGSGEYVPLSQRRPSVLTNLCRTVVDDSVSLLFSEGHFPSIRADDEATAEVLSLLVKDRRLNELMIDAATRGSVGSIAIHFAVLRNKPFFRVMGTAYLTPEYDPLDPDALVSVTERYKVPAAELAAQGYAVDPKDGQHWFMRRWDATHETWFIPWPCHKRDHVPQVDAARTVEHGLGFVPIVWVRNLPGGESSCDGACTFEAAISTSIEMDYLLSQAGRGLKYAGDPRLVIRDPGASQDRPITGGASSAIVLMAAEAEAKFLEISGDAAGAMQEHARTLRSFALEAVHGVRADPDKVSAATSGRALEMLHQNLIWLADRLRTSYGEGALLSLLRMVCAASSRMRGGIIVAGEPRANLSDKGLSLVWPRWFAPTAEDRQSDATTAKTLSEAGIVSRETLLRNVAQDYDVEDVDAELALIEGERAKAMEEAREQMEAEAAVQSPKDESPPPKG